MQDGPESKPSKLAELTYQGVVSAEPDLDQSADELLAEMEAAWEEDWSEL
jgi:hypothetical protein